VTGGAGRGAPGALRRARARAALALALALGACAGRGTPAPELLGLEGRDRETLAAVYPPGTLREVVRAREGAPLVFSIHACDFGTLDQDPALSAALDAFRTEFPRITPSCDRVRLARSGWVTLLGGFAYYQDYVFYDAEDQVVIAYRTFLQRSGD
jgi:hypothetical protein